MLSLASRRASHIRLEDSSQCSTVFPDLDDSVDVFFVAVAAFILFWPFQELCKSLFVLANTAHIPRSVRTREHVYKYVELFKNKLTKPKRSAWGNIMYDSQCYHAVLNLWASAPLQALLDFITHILATSVASVSLSVGCTAQESRSQDAQITIRQKSLLAHNLQITDLVEKKIFLEKYSRIWNFIYGQYGNLMLLLSWLIGVKYCWDSIHTNLGDCMDYGLFVDKEDLIYLFATVIFFDIAIARALLCTIQIILVYAESKKKDADLHKRFEEAKEYGKVRDMMDWKTERLRVLKGDNRGWKRSWLRKEEIMYNFNWHTCYGGVNS